MVFPFYNRFRSRFQDFAAQFGKTMKSILYRLSSTIDAYLDLSHYYYSTHTSIVVLMVQKGQGLVPVHKATSKLLNKANEQEFHQPKLHNMFNEQYSSFLRPFFYTIKFAIFWLHLEIKVTQTKLSYSY